MSSTRNLRKSVLCMAMGACLSSLVAGPVLAQAVTGAVAGHAQAGTTVTISNPATGQSRTATVGADGSYRIAQLAPGQYTLTSGSGAPVSVVVSLGGTTTVNLGNDGAVDLATVQVMGSAVVNRVDVYSTESSTNMTRQELARLPVDQSLGAVALLAPGVVSSGATFGGLTFGGSSIAENVTYINGLDVTDPYLRQGFSSVPYNFYEEVQIKTGGYSAEFGRSTGGVINAVTRSGSNEFHGGMEITAQPSAFSSQREDHFHTDGTLDARDRTSRDESPLFKTNVWASGPIMKDRLFFFAMYENRDADSRDVDTSEAWKTTSNNDFWGGKIDWHVNDSNLLELLAFSDKADSATTHYLYDWDSAAYGDELGSGTSGSGGDNWSATWTSQITSNFVAKAMYGVNKRSASSGGGAWDADCSIVVRADTYEALYGETTDQVGCSPTNSAVSNRIDTRKAARLDFEWTLGNHLLRFGADQETMDSDSSSIYPGDGWSYTIEAINNKLHPGDPATLNGELLPDHTAYVDARRKFTGTPVSTQAQAVYIEDNWSVTPNLLLNIGIRGDKFHNKLASGGTFAKADFSDMMSPRVGFSWDMKGDGTTKLFGNAGRYYIPLTNKLTDYFGGGTTDEHAYYYLNGWTTQTDPINNHPYQFPVLGAQIGPLNTDGNVEAPDDVRTAVARDLKQVFQDEYIVGFQQALDQAWSWGVNATYREVSRAIEDVSIRHVEGCPWYSGDFPILNPGETNTLWCPDTNDWVTFDNSVDGYKASGSGDIFGYKKPKRTYKGVEFQLDRAWDGKWSFNASYLWSKSEGNIEGPVNSDTGYADTNLVQFYDHPAVNERYGVLFNDHRHQIKLRGAYKFSEMWSVGATFSAVSGGPITAFGVRWPDDNRGFGPGEFSGGGSGWLCVSGCSDYTTRVLEYSPRGAFGRLPWVKDLSGSVTWTLPVEGVDLKARLSVHNLLNSQTTINVHSRYEGLVGVPMPYFGQGTVWQSPRYAQLVVTYNF